MEEGKKCKTIELKSGKELPKTKSWRKLRKKDARREKMKMMGRSIKTNSSTWTSKICLKAPLSLKATEEQIEPEMLKLSEHLGKVDN